MKTFYIAIYHKSERKGYSGLYWMPVKGTIVRYPLLSKFIFFAHKNMNKGVFDYNYKYDGSWYGIYESSTGCKVVDGKRRKDAVAELMNCIKKVGEEKFIKIVSDVRKNHAKLPKLTKEQLDKDQAMQNQLWHDSYTNTTIDGWQYIDLTANERDNYEMIQDQNGEQITYSS